MFDYYVKNNYNADDDCMNIDILAKELANVNLNIFKCDVYIDILKHRVEHLSQ